MTISPKIKLVPFHDTCNYKSHKTIGQIIFYFYDIRKDELAIKEKTDFNTVNEELRTIRLLAKKIQMNRTQLDNVFKGDKLL